MASPVLNRMAFNKFSLLAFVLIFAGIGGYVLLHSNAATLNANLWIDTDGGTCTRQATAGAYIDAQACSSMQAAMSAAQAGDTVVMKNGTYPAQTISSGTKASAVSFYAETYDHAVTAKDAYSATTGVFVSSLSLSGVDKIHIFGIQATPTPNNARTDAHLTYAGGGDLGICSSGCTATATTDILVDGFHGRSAFIRATGVVIDHSSFGGWDSCYDTNGNHLASGNSGTEDGFRFWDGTGGSSTPSNSVVRNTVFHDIIMGVNDSELSSVCTYGSSFGPHSDCMQNNGGSGLTVEDDIFFNCPSSDIQWNPFSGATVGTQTIQNNYFGPIGGIGNGTVIGAQSGGNFDCSGVIVRNNLYNGVGINYSSAGCTGGVPQIYGNIFGTSCFSTQGANYHDNIFAATGCGTNVRSCTPTFVSTPATSPNWLATSTPDFHLASSDTCAKDHGYSVFPPTDFEGDSRPQGSASDAGPDEVLTASGPTANLWVAPNGSDSGANCIRFTAAVTNPDPSGASLCQSLTKAYQLASPGDNVFMLGGTYTARQFFTAAMKKADGSHCDYGSGDLSGCITFAPASGASVTFNVAGSNTVAISSCVTYLRIQNITINKTTYTDSFGDTVSNGSIGVGAGDNTCGATPPHDNLFENISYGGQAGVVGGAYNTYIVGGVVTGENDLPWQFYGQGNNGLIAGSHDNGLIGVNFQGYNFTNDDSANHHMECVHVDVGSSTASGLIFRDNTFVGCPLYSISFQAFGTGTIDSAIIEGNVFGNTSNGSLYLDLHANGGAITNNVVRFNTFESPTAFDPFYQPGVVGTVSGNTYYGNLNPVCTSTAGWTPSYNVYSVPQTNNCVGDNTSAYNQAISFVSPASPSYNWHLANCTQTAADFVAAGSVGGYPPVDISNITRPQGSRLDAGAFEDCPAGTPTSKTGDINGDGRIDILDLSILLSHYNQAANSSQGDLNNNNFCDITDLSILLSNWGK